MTKPYAWDGEIHRDGDGIAGLLRDPHGNTIHITGTRTASGYTLHGIPGPMPEWLKLPIVDDD